MDPAGLLISIATLAIILDDVTDSYHAASGTLSLVKTQIKILETSAQRIQEWLHYTDTADQAKIRQSLRDSIATVDGSLGRLREDLESITRTGPRAKKMLGRQGSDQWVKAKFVLQESLLRKHLTDVRECTSLLHFTLNVCQLPVSGVDREVQELELGAKTLQRAQTSARRERRSLIQDSQANPSQEHSENFNVFMKSIMDAEADLPEDEASTPPENIANGTVDMPRGLLNGSAAREPMDELNLPRNESQDAMPAPLSVTSSVDNASPTSTLVSTVSRPDSEGLIPAIASPGGINGHAGPSPAPIATVPYPSAQSNVQTLVSGTILPYPDSPALSTSQTPAIPAKLPQGEAQSPSVQRQLSRKPVGTGRRSVSAVEKSPVPPPSIVSEQSTYGSSDDGRDAPAPDHAFREKLLPIRRSLASLPTNDYMNVQFDDTLPQPGPVQPYTDAPPSYEPVSPTSPRSRARMSRRGTSRSSLLSDTTPYLIKLVRENRIDEISYQVQQSTNLNDADPKTGRTPIMEAARFRRWDIARLLIQAGCQMHLKDIDGNTALHLCAKQGDGDICQMLVDGGAQPADCNLAGATPLELAAAGGHLEAVLCLLNNMPARKANDTTVLKAFFEAVKLGDVSTAQAFLAKEVKPKKVKESWKFVCYAAQSGSIPMLELMLAQKCPLKDRSPAGWNALHFAARHNRQPMVERLLDLKMPWKAQTKKQEETALHLACVYGFSSLAQALIAHKDANVTMRDADGQEPIHHAIRNGDMKLTTALLDEGASFKNGNKYGWKPIHLATAYGHMALVAEMMTRGISLEEKLGSPSFKPEKRTNEAARRGYWAEVRWPFPGCRPLHLALEFGHDDIANMLISGGAKVNESDSNDWTPLHYAAFNCRPEMVELLLGKGATPDAKTDDGFTALRLGFREYGLSADQAQRDRVYDALSFAVAHRKKSMFGQMTSQINSSLPSLPKSSSGPKPSKLVAQRNAAWHKAQLAESLYKADNVNEGEDDDSVTTVEGGSSIQEMNSMYEEPGPVEKPA